jgi:hypothetical protein
MLINMGWTAPSQDRVPATWYVHDACELYTILRRLLASTVSSTLFQLSALSATIGRWRVVSYNAIVGHTCICNVKCLTTALLRGPPRLAVLLNGISVLHVGLHICHAKPRADTAWPHGRGLAACLRAMVRRRGKATKGLEADGG